MSGWGRAFVAVSWLTACAGTPKHLDPKLCVASQRARAEGRYAGFEMGSPEGKAAKDEYWPSCSDVCIKSSDAGKEDKAACTESAWLSHFGHKDLNASFGSVIGLCERDKNADACAWVAAHPEEVALYHRNVAIFSAHYTAEQLARTQPRAPAGADPAVQAFADEVVRSATSNGYSGPSMGDHSTGVAQFHLMAQPSTTYLIFILGPSTASFSATLSDRSSTFSPVNGAPSNVYALTTMFRTSAGSPEPVTVTVRSTGSGKLRSLMFMKPS
jgi:hypothetical protein